MSARAVRFAITFVATLVAALGLAGLAGAEEPPALAAEVAAGKLPPLASRLPQPPLVVDLKRPNWTEGVYGGEMRMLMAKDRDIRMMVVYGYSRLVGYDEQLRIVPDILESVDDEGGKVFTLHLRRGHKWSDGQPFTAADFRYYWEDVVNNKDLSPFGLPQALLVRDRGPRFEVLNDTTVRYTWDDPNPQFLAALAGPSPLYIFRPAHYLRKYHPKYIGLEKANAQATAAGSRSWAGLHQKKDEQYRFDNPDLPTLEPWMNTTPLPSTRFVLVRNPYFHRVDASGRQLPYIDRVVVGISEEKLIPAKSGAGDVDLQTRYLRFDNYTFLKQNEKRNRYKVLLWEKVLGSQIALYPNLNVDDAEWRKLMRDARFRRALSIAIDRHEINEVVYFGLGREASDTVLLRSPLYKPEFGAAWSQHDPKAANALLDELGLNKRNTKGIRLLPDGRPMEVVVDTSGESTEETDVLELVRDSWQKVGIALYSRPSQREVFRKRVFSGKSMMSVWSGLSNGIPTPEMSPLELAPTAQEQLQWPMWGQYYENNRKGGQVPDMPEALELVQLYDAWRVSSNDAEREKIWHRMLEIHAQQVFTIGIVTRALQPVVVNDALRNVPTEGIYSWDPGSYFGFYHTDTFWFDPEGTTLMLRYVVNRILLMIPTMIAISIIVFIIIQLPPGNYLESYIAELQAQGESIDPQKIAFLRNYYGLDKPLVEQYLRWAGGMLVGDFGYSFEFNLPVTKVIGDRMLLTIIVSGITILFTWAVAFPIGIYSATHQYSWGDYGLSLLGFLGIAIPNFMLALVMMYLANVWFGTSIGGLMSPEYIGKPWSWGKVLSVLEHSWIPVIVIGTHSTAGMIRRLRANLLDELQKQYVVTARAKGLPPRKVLFKYPLRMALNFFISDIGSILPHIISGTEITAVVLSLPTAGPMLLNALKSQDMYLAGSFLMFLAAMIVIGVLVSDLALMALDPRIRLQGGVTR